MLNPGGVKNSFHPFSALSGRDGQTLAVFVHVLQQLSEARNQFQLSFLFSVPVHVGLDEFGIAAFRTVAAAKSNGIRTIKSDS